MASLNYLIRSLHDFCIAITSAHMGDYGSDLQYKGPCATRNHHLWFHTILSTCRMILKLSSRLICTASLKHYLSTWFQGILTTLQLNSSRLLLRQVLQSQDRTTTYSKSKFVDILIIFNLFKLFRFCSIIN